MLTRLASLLVLLTVLGGCRSTSPSSEAPQFLATQDSAMRSFPFSEAVRVGNVLHLSGQIGVMPGTLDLAPGGIEAESVQTLANIRTVLERHGSSLGEVFKCTVFLADIAEWPAFNAVYSRTFSAPYPARSALATTGLALGARVEVECLAYVAE